MPGPLKYLVWCGYFAASFSHAQHVPGVNNQIADAKLSHFCWQDFRQLVPDAQPHPSLISLELLEALTSLLYLRAAMLFLLDPRPCSVYTSFVWFCPSKVYFLLQSAGEVTSFRVLLPSRWMDTAFSSLFLLGPFSILLSRYTYLGLELSTLNKGFLICYWTAFVSSGLYVAPSTVTVLLLPTDFPLPMIWCWSFGILWIFTFWIIACSRHLVP